MTGDPILPGATIGVLGGGQLGRMFALSAQSMGYHVAVYSPEKDSPAAEVCAWSTCAGYGDEPALLDFASRVEVVTIEFENIPASTLTLLSHHTKVRPNPEVLHISQNRLREKNYLKEKSFPIVPYHHVRSLDDLHRGLGQIGTPAVLKTAGFGYDGKGQARIRSIDEANTVYAGLKDQDLILESFVDFTCEISVIGARGMDKSFAAFGPVENRHCNHILDLSLIPAEVPESIARQAVEMTGSLMSELDVVGLLCVEFFLTAKGELLINEMAPRPHNSGHYSLDACMTSQFEQQVRAVTGLPLGDARLRSPAVMLNLLGDLWTTGTPDWESCLKLSDTHLHLYGKSESRKGRKMGHLTALAETREKALSQIIIARKNLVNAP